MYENNYNYIDVSENEKKKSGGAKKTAALILAVVIAGGASGFGGAYLQNRLMPADAPAAVSDTADKQSASSENQTTAAAASVLSDNKATAVNTLLGGSSSENGTLTTEQIVHKITPSVVSVHSQFSNGSGTGTGIIMSSDGYIITNAHVVQNDEQEYVSNGNNYDPYDFFGGFFGGSYQTVTKQAEKVTVILSDDETEYDAEIIGLDTDSDLAVIKVDANGLSAAEFGNSDEIAMGSKAVAVGYPMGLGLSVSEGIISGLNRSLSVELSTGGSASLTLIQTDAAINPGNSGGPLINEYGQVIGITSSKLATVSVEGLGFAIPITDAMPLINDLMNQGYVTNRTPIIGISGSEITPAVMRYYGLPVENGIMVVKVDKDSGADAAGICEGDVIIAADGKDIKSMDDLTKIKNKKEIGDTLTLTLARSNGNVDVDVVLGSVKEDDNN